MDKPNLQRSSSLVKAAGPTLPYDLDFLAWNRDEYDVAKLCGCSVQGVRRLRAAGRGPRFKKIGALVRYSLAATFEWLDGQPGGGGA